MAGSSQKWQEGIGVALTIGGRFPLYLHGERYDNGEGGIEPGGPGWADLIELDESAWNDADRRTRVLAAYENSIRDHAQRFNVVLVYPIPEAGWNVPSYAFRNAYFNGGDTTLTTSYANYLQRTKEVNTLFDNLIDEMPTVHGARVHEVFCSTESGRCLNADDRGVYYYDDDHLSNAGAVFVKNIIVDAIQDVLCAQSENCNN